MAEGNAQGSKGKELHNAGKVAPGADGHQSDDPTAAPESGQPEGGRDKPQRAPGGASGGSNRDKA